MTLRTIAMAQIAAHLGDVDANLALHLDMIGKAKSQGAELIVFPELSLTGYALQDLTPQVARKPLPDDPTFNPLIKASKDIDIIVGFVEAESRHRFYIAAAYLSNGDVLYVHRKVYLPTYGLFDEGRFFARGDRVRAFDSPFGRIGILICEDFWHISPPYLLWLDGAEILILISAAPGRGISGDDRLESARWVERIAQAYASIFTTFVIHTNRVGFEDGLHFWGGATAFDPDGVMLARGPYHEQALTLARIDPAQLHRTRTRLPLLRDERAALTQRELNRILGELQ